MSKIMPCIWYDDQAEEAANFYVSLFKDGRILHVAHYPQASEEVTGKPAGSVMTVNFEIAGQEYLALNGGPDHPLTDAVSFIINADSQEEVDELWDKITADGGEEGPCGWCKDRFGLWWQVVPKGFMELTGNPDRAKANKAMAAMMKMKKLDINKLREEAEA